MFTLNLTLDAFSVYVVVADVIALILYVLYLRHKKRRLDKAAEKISQFVKGYFMNTGTEVKVNCIKLDSHISFVVFIESSPLKSFRYSNLLETSLISHIEQVTGHSVEKIYWRFPIQLRDYEAPVQAEVSTENNDAYFSDVQEQAKTNVDYNVSEVSWEEFEKGESANR
jgi:hypothetical protein